MVVNLSLSLAAWLETAGYLLLGCPYPAKMRFGNSMALLKRAGGDFVELLYISKLGLSIDFS